MHKALITNLTRRTSDIQAMRQFRAKLELEAKFQRKVKRLLDTMIREFDDLYSNVGLILPAEAFFPNWKDLLIEIYVDTTKIFSRSMRFGTKSKQMLIACLNFLNSILPNLLSHTGYVTYY